MQGIPTCRICNVSGVFRVFNRCATIPNQNCMSHQLLADELLVRLLKISDSQAFEAIYLRHWKRVYRLALSKVRNPETAEDITQQVFVSLWERRMESEISSLEAYLATAVKYRCISHFESKYFRTTVSGLDSAEVQSDSATEDSLIHGDLTRAVDRALARLPAKTREVFELRKLHDYSVREIADRLGISEKAVEYHVTQSIKVMRHELREYLYPLRNTTLPLAAWLLC
jgi:RNA polymerase sigma-70 factor (family 1)